MSVKTNILLIASLFAALLVAAVSLLVHLGEKHALQSIAIRQTALVETLTSGFDQQVSARHGVLITIAENFPRDRLGAPVRLQAFLREQVALPALFAYTLIYGVDGTVLAANPSPETPVGGKCLAPMKDIVRTVESRKPLISEPFVCPLTNQPTIMMTAPILDKNGMVVAILGGGQQILSDRLYSGFADTRVGKSGIAFLYTRDRVAIAHPDRSRLMERLAPGANPALDMALDASSFAGETASSGGVPSLTAIETMKTTGWLAGVTVPLDEVYEPITAMRRQAIQVTIGLLLVLSVLVWLGTGRGEVRAYRVVSRTGAVRWALNRSKVVRGEGDTLIADSLIIDITAEVEARQALERREAELREKSAWLETLLRTLPDGVVVQDAAGRIVYSNPASETILGWSEGRLQGQTAEDLERGEGFIHEDGSPFPAHDHPTMRALRTGLPQRDVAMGLRRPGGERVWIRINSDVLELHDGRPSQVMTIFSNITDRMRSRQALMKGEADLRETARHLKSLVDNLPGTVFRLLYHPDNSKRVLYANLGSALPEQSIRTSDEMTAASPDRFAAMFPEEDHHLLFVEVPRRLRETGFSEQRFRHYRSDGTIGWLLARERVVGWQGEDMITEGLTIDVTAEMEAKQALERGEAELRETAGHLKALIDNLPGLIFRLRYHPDNSKQVLYASTGVLHLKQELSTPDEVTAASPDRFAAMFPQEDHHLLFVEVPRRLRETGFSEQRFRYYRVDGSIGWMLARERVVGWQGEDMITEGLTIDVTAEMEARQALENRQKERLSHLWFLESLDRISRVLQRTNDLDRAMGDVLEEMLAVFGCDRAWLVFPCDPETASYRVPFEKTVPDYPGAHARDLDIPLDSGTAAFWRTLDDAGTPIQLGGSAERSIPEYIARAFTIRSFFAMKVTPRLGKPWLFGMHQCSRERDWTADETRLFQEIGRRLADSLNTFLAFRSVAEKEAEVRETAEHLKALIENLPGVVYRMRLTPTARHLTYLSERFERQYGLPPERFKAMSLTERLEMVHPDDRADFAARWARMNAEGRVMARARFLRPDGWVRWFEYHERVIERHGEDLIAEGVVLDITEEMDAKQELERQERRRLESQKLEALGQLAGGVAHDFNNFLGAMLGYARFILEDTGPAHPAHGHARRLLIAGQRGKAVVEQILAFARPGTGQRTRFRLADVVGETLDMLKASIPASTQLKTAVIASDAVIEADRTQVGQVLLNLCLNAHDALGGEPGEVRVAVRTFEGGAPALERLAGPGGDDAGTAVEAWTAEDGSAWAVGGHFDPARPAVSLSVADTGCGMDAKLLSRVFAPFFTTKPRGRGTGLGLAVIQGIVQAHGGAIVVSSRPGEGTCVEVVLPRAEAAMTESVASVSAATGLLTARVLLVDDDLDFGDMLAQALERRGCEVAVCSSAAEALDGLREAPDLWDVVVTDQVMPGMSGLELARHIGDIRADLPCVLCTGYPGDTDPATLESAGIKAVFGKPLDMETVFATLGRLLERRRAG